MTSLLTNLSWKFAERIASQAVSFVVSIILARILDPSDYGAIAMVMIFVALANVISEGGFNSALIQKKGVDKLDYSTVFYFSIVFSLILYGILYISAPYISMFYGKGYEILTPVLRVLGIQVILFSVNSIQRAYVSKNMMFKNFFWATLIGTIVSAIVGLSMAYLGYGIWALVGQQLSMALTNIVVLYIITKKLPGLMFSFERLHGLFGYGVKILGASLLVTAFLNLRSLVIGKIYSAKDLAFFDRGLQLPNLLVTNINSSIDAVLFPKMAQNQDDKFVIKQTCRNSIRFSSFIMSPLMIGMAACAEPLVRLLLTEKWLDSVPFLQLFCIIYMFYPMHTANMQAIKALGHSGTFLKLEIVKKTLEVISLLLVMHISVMAIAVNMVILTTIFTYVNAYPNIKLLSYTFKEQMMDIFPPIIMSSIMGIIVYALGFFFQIADLWLLIIQVICGCSIYLTICFLTKNNETIYLYNLVRNKIHFKFYKL